MGRRNCGLDNSGPRPEDLLRFLDPQRLLDSLIRSLDAALQRHLRNLLPTPPNMGSGLGLPPLPPTSDRFPRRRRPVNRFKAPRTPGRRLPFLSMEEDQEDPWNSSTNITSPTETQHTPGQSDTGEIQLPQNSSEHGWVRLPASLAPAQHQSMALDRPTEQNASGPVLPLFPVESVPPDLLRSWLAGESVMIIFAVIPLPPQEERPADDPEE
ncbi:hypothetical protein V5799_011419 [Amblyomma americanum]|uniref:Uncharacterized protein n=1 Tax=Amblyomma americanum TaxID=6943 RepID=A0AAQ4EGZ8_AMBAM